ncbi:MAG: phosphatidylserine decarboxylase [Planctomycetes bacterium]|nr:phosphatidylserine decarboxylase [Planctomycetota bacterium]
MPLTSYGAKEIVIGTGVFCLSTLVVFSLYRHYGNHWFLLFLIPLILLFLWLLWFFRDPKRTIPNQAGVIVSPADGIVTHLDEADEPDFIGGRAKRLSIFLSVFDVHLNRIPAPGRVEFIRFRPGTFFDARREESLTKNQNQDIGLAVEEAGLPGRMVVRQSAGAIARSIVCPVVPGMRFKRGERYGMIKFGSRTTLFLSPDAEIEWLVKVGDPVKAGETMVARLARPASREARLDAPGEE